MKTFFSITLIVLSIYNIDAQDKIFLTKNFFETTESKAYYYRIITEDSTRNGYYIQKDYWISGELYQDIELSSLVPYKKDGVSKQYYENGQLKYEIEYANSKINGYVKGYYETGVLKREDYYKNDSLTSGSCYSVAGKDTIHYPYFKMPEYKNGGIEGFREFVSNNIIYPHKAHKKGIEGRVYVYFCIASNGMMTNVKIQKSDNKLLNKEAKRIVLKSSSDWSTGYYEGDKAKIALNMPVNFVLE